MRPSAYDSLGLTIKQTSPWITLFIINHNSLFDILRGFLQGGRKILEDRTSFCWVYMQKFWPAIVVVFQLILMYLTNSAFNNLSNQALIVTFIGTFYSIFGLMLYLGHRTGPKYWTSLESSESSAHGNTKQNSFYLLWLPTEPPAPIWSGLSLVLGSF